jgi:uncharacterized protein (DUF1015 family)
MPQLHLLSKMFWNAFQSLSGRRYVNEHGQQPIQISEIVAYADLLGITDPDDREDLLYHIEAMDRLYIADAYKRRESARKLAQKKAKGKTAPRMGR